MVQTTDFAKQNKTKKSQANQNSQNSQPRSHREKTSFLYRPIDIISTSQTCCVFFFFFGNPVTYCRLLNCSNATFLRGMGSTSLPGSFVFLQEGVVDHSLLWEDERPWERGWSGIGHKNAKTNTRAQR